jgi:glycosyltransferase involved in cell wall biosynthesis
MPKKKVIFYTDCFVFAGCEKAIYEIMNSEIFCSEFQYLLVYRYSKEYENAINSFSSIFRIKNKTGVRLIDVNSWNLYWERNIKNIHLFKILRKVSNIIFRIISPIVFVYDFIILYFLFFKEKADIVHINNGGYPGSLSCNAAVLAAKCATVNRIILSVHNIAAPVRGVIDKGVDFLVSKSISIVICASDASKLSLINRRNFDKNKIAKIYYGIRLPDSNMAINKNQLIDLSVDGNYISMVARFEERKGHRIAIYAMKKLLKNYPEYAKLKLLFIGEGPLMKELNSLVASEGLAQNILFMGQRSDCLEYIGRSIFLIHPSVAYESLPYSIIEAMSMGIPSIGTNIAGIPEEIENNITGILIPAGDMESLVQAMRDLLSDYQKRIKMGIAAKKKYHELFWVNEMVKNYMKIY